MAMGENTVRENFKEIHMESEHSFTYVTGFSNNSLILAMAIGILELFARFKQDSSKYLKLLNRKLTEASNQARETFPDHANNIDFYMGFINQVKELNETDAFTYIFYYTINSKENYVNIIEIGFRMIVAQLFVNKKSYMLMIEENINLEKIKFLIFYRISQDFGIHLEIYGIDHRETIKNENLGEFPIINVLVFNNQYYLVYNSDSINQFNSIPLADEVKLRPPFLICTRNVHAPIGSPAIQSPAVSIQNTPINYNDTVGLTKMIIEKLSNELTKFEFSKEISEFISECLRLNTDLAAIPSLKKFVSPIQSSRIMPSAEVNEDILADTSTYNIRQSASHANIVCNGCRTSRPHNHFSSSIHYSCRICLYCAQRNDNCLCCRYPYTNQEKAALRNNYS